jgi:outer membrane protein assembly factor BamE (lipoprotein component of BamABCDE complex)
MEKLAMTNLQLTLLGCVLLLLHACTTSGNPSIKDETEASINDKIRQGVTSKDEVTAMLGDPLEADFINDGQEVWTYELSRITPLARNYIPYVNVLSSGSDAVEQKLTILFDENDIVEDFNWLESVTERRTGVLVKP